METERIMTLKNNTVYNIFLNFISLKGFPHGVIYEFTCIEPPNPSRGEQGQPSKPDHPSSCSYNVSDRDVDYDISAESAFNHPGTKKRIYGETFLAQKESMGKVLDDTTWLQWKAHNFFILLNIPHSRCQVGICESAGGFQRGPGICMCLK